MSTNRRSVPPSVVSAHTASLNYLIAKIQVARDNLSVTEKSVEFVQRELDRASRIINAISDGLQEAVVTIPEGTRTAAETSEAAARDRWDIYTSEDRDGAVTVTLDLNLNLLIRMIQLASNCRVTDTDLKPPTADEQRYMEELVSYLEDTLHRQLV